MSNSYDFKTRLSYPLLVYSVVVNYATISNKLVSELTASKQVSGINISFAVLTIFAGAPFKCQ